MHPIEMKFICSLAGWGGAVLIPVLAAISIAWGWSRAMDLLRNFSVLFITILVACLFLVSVAAGVLLLEPKGLFHYMLRWTAWDYAAALAWNLVRVFTPLAVTIGLFLMDSGFWDKGWHRRMAFGFGVCAVFYLLGCAIYILALPFVIE